MVGFDLLSEFDKYTIKNIPRINNKYVDTMASILSLMPIDIKDEELILKIKILGILSCIAEDEEIEVYCITK